MGSLDLFNNKLNILSFIYLRNYKFGYFFKVYRANCSRILKKLV